MNFITSRFLKSSSFLNALVIAFSLSLTFLSSCEGPSIDDELQRAQPQMLEVEDPLCVIGEEREFGMDLSEDPSLLLQNMSYRLTYAPLPIYNPSDECLCRVHHLELEFDYLPLPGYINIVDEGGVGLAFSVPDPAIPVVEVYMNHYEPIVYIGFDPSVNTIPQLTLSGGLCMVDNISAPDPSSGLTIPYSEYNTETRKTETYLPTVTTWP